jgi:NAD(P)-dependent dehydrogenase (short-subunit alcohol dehydrogenase family)
MMQKTIQFDFNDRVAVVTGGTSGIGLATARMLLESGAKVLIVGRDRAKGELIIKESGPHRGNLKFICADVSSVTECESTIAMAVKFFGRIDILINSAGVYSEKLIGDVSEDEYDYIMDINVKGTYFMCKYAIPELEKSEAGAIVNVSSDSGLQGTLHATAYCASKGAVTIFTKSLALELASNNIRVNCVCPGDVATPMLARQFEEAEDKEKYYNYLLGLYPIGRFGKPEEVAAVICFLASPASSFVAGSAWPVDGGITAF